jgi:predicted enzyme related to lactoylglutathione lyase
MTARLAVEVPRGEDAVAAIGKSSWLVLLSIGLLSLSPGCGGESRPDADPKSPAQYVEIVGNDVDALVGLYQRAYGLTFGSPDADLGQARVATRPDGTLVGIRKPLAAHEQPVVRTYLAVEDIQKAVKQAAAAGAEVAYPPTRQGSRGTFAIVFQGGVQHGLWQR